MFNINKLSIGFSKLVRDINTINPNWKKYIGKIDLQLRNHLDNEIFYNNIIQYNLNIERIGQSIIKCNIIYIEKHYERPKKILSMKE